MKAALTLDGQLAAADGTSQWISSPEARQDAHRLRAEVDAIMVGAGTLRADNPRLTVRIETPERVDQPQPTPVVVAGTGMLSAEARLFRRDPIILAPTRLDLPGRLVLVPDASGQRVDLSAGLARLGEMGIRKLMVEGGATLFRSLLAAGVIDEAALYYGPILAGGLGSPLFGGRWATLRDAHPIRVVDVQRLGESVRLNLALRPEQT